MYPKKKQINKVTKLPVTSNGILLSYFMPRIIKKHPIPKNTKPIGIIKPCFLIAVMLNLILSDNESFTIKLEALINPFGLFFF